MTRKKERKKEKRKKERNDNIVSQKKKKNINVDISNLDLSKIMAIAVFLVLVEPTFIKSKHINLCGLFNVKASLYIYIKKSLAGFYSISTIVGCLMPNPLYTYILNIYDLVWLGFMAYQPL